MIRDRILNHMYNNNITKVKLEELSGVGIEILRRYLNGQADMRVSNVEKIMKALNLKVV